MLAEEDVEEEVEAEVEGNLSHYPPFGEAPCKGDSGKEPTGKLPGWLHASETWLQIGSMDQWSGT